MIGFGRDFVRVVQLFTRPHFSTAIIGNEVLFLLAFGLLCVRRSWDWQFWAWIRSRNFRLSPSGEPNWGSLKTSRISEKNIAPRGFKWLSIRRPWHQRRTFDRRRFCIHWENYISISFHIEWDMIVVTVFLSILNQMEFHLVQKIERKMVTTIISNSIWKQM